MTRRRRDCVKANRQMGQGGGGAGGQGEQGNGRGGRASLHHVVSPVLEEPIHGPETLSSIDDFAE